MSGLKIGIEGLKNSLEHDAAELNLAMVKENDASSHRKACQTAYENSRLAFELGCAEVMAAATVVLKTK